MTEHPPPSPAAALGADPAAIPTTSDSAADPGAAGADVVAGDPPVPITVWRTAEAPDEHTATVPSRLAHRLVAAYSSPGEVIVDLTGAPALAAAARRAGRHHRAASFTDTSAVVLGPVSPGDEPHTLPRPGTDPPDPPGRHAAGDPATAGADDADADAGAGGGTGRRRPRLPPRLDGDPPGRCRPPGPGACPAATEEHGGGTDAGPVTGLVVACWPLHAQEATNADRLGSLLRVGVGLLRRGGCLVLLASAPTGQPGVPQATGPLAAAAAAAGLGYLQHIVAVRAAVDGDRFTYYADPAELAALTDGSAADGGFEDGPRHLRVHADLMVFTRREQAAGA
jgi:hypothetical protein